MNTISKIEKKLKKKLKKMIEEKQKLNKQKINKKKTWGFENNTRKGWLELIAGKGLTDQRLEIRFSNEYLGKLVFKKIGSHFGLILFQ